MFMLKKYKIEMKKFTKINLQNQFFFLYFIHNHLYQLKKKFEKNPNIVSQINDR